MESRERRSLDERWQDFRKLSHLKEHWYWRPGWRTGRSFYTWHLTFAECTALHNLVRRIQLELATPALDLVPIPGLHLTMQGVGFTDEVHADDLADIVKAVQDHCRAISPFSLDLGPVDPDREGIGLLIDPWLPVDQTRMAIRAGIGDVWGESCVPEPAEGFRPHVTVAYSASNAETGPLFPVLAHLRLFAPVSVDVNQAQLIRLRRDARTYEWDVVASAMFEGR